jgi:hypothetical protein
VHTLMTSFVLRVDVVELLGGLANHIYFTVLNVTENCELTSRESNPAPFGSKMVNCPLSHRKATQRQLEVVWICVFVIDDVGVL